MRGADAHASAAGAPGMPPSAVAPWSRHTSAVDMPSAPRGPPAMLPCSACRGSGISALAAPRLPVPGLPRHLAEVLEPALEEYVRAHAMPTWKRRLYNRLVHDAAQALRRAITSWGLGDCSVKQDDSTTHGTDNADSDVDLVIEIYGEDSLPKRMRGELYDFVELWLRYACGGRYSQVQFVKQLRKSAELQAVMAVRRCWAPAHRACTTCGGLGGLGEAGGEAAAGASGDAEDGAGVASACRTCGCCCQGSGGVQQGAGHGCGPGEAAEGVLLSADLLFESASVGAPLGPMARPTEPLARDPRAEKAAQNTIRVLKTLQEQVDSLWPLPSYVLEAMTMTVMLECDPAPQQVPASATATATATAGGGSYSTAAAIGRDGVAEVASAGRLRGGPEPPPTQFMAQAIFMVLGLFAAAGGARALDSRVHRHCAVPAGYLYDKGAFTNWRNKAKRLKRVMVNMAGCMLDLGKGKEAGEPMSPRRAAETLEQLFRSCGRRPSGPGTGASEPAADVSGVDDGDQEEADGEEGAESEEVRASRQQERADAWFAAAAAGEGLARLDKYLSLRLPALEPVMRSERNAAAAAAVLNGVLLTAEGRAAWLAKEMSAAPAPAAQQQQKAAAAAPVTTATPCAAARSHSTSTACSGSRARARELPGTPVRSTATDAGVADAMDEDQEDGSSSTCSSASPAGDDEVTSRPTRHALPGTPVQQGGGPGDLNLLVQTAPRPAVQQSRADVAPPDPTCPPAHPLRATAPTPSGSRYGGSADAGGGGAAAPACSPTAGNTPLMQQAAAVPAETAAVARPPHPSLPPQFITTVAAGPAPAGGPGLRRGPAPQGHAGTLPGTATTAPPAAGAAHAPIPLTAVPASHSGLDMGGGGDVDLGLGATNGPHLLHTGGGAWAEAGNEPVNGVRGLSRRPPAHAPPTPPQPAPHPLAGLFAHPRAAAAGARCYVRRRAAPPAATTGGGLQHPGGVQGAAGAGPRPSPSPSRGRGGEHAGGEGARHGDGYAQTLLSMDRWRRTAALAAARSTEAAGGRGSAAHVPHTQLPPPPPSSQLHDALNAHLAQTQQRLRSAVQAFLSASPLPPPQPQLPLGFDGRLAAPLQPAAAPQLMQPVLQLPAGDYTPRAMPSAGAVEAMPRQLAQAGPQTAALPGATALSGGGAQRVLAQHPPAGPATVLTAAATAAPGAVASPVPPAAAFAPPSHLPAHDTTPAADGWQAAPGATRTPPSVAPSPTVPGGSRARAYPAAAAAAGAMHSPPVTVERATPAAASGAASAGQAGLTAAGAIAGWDPGVADDAITGHQTGAHTAAPEVAARGSRRRASLQAMARLSPSPAASSNAVGVCDAGGGSPGAEWYSRSGKEWAALNRIEALMFSPGLNEGAGAGSDGRSSRGSNSGGGDAWHEGMEEEEAEEVCEGLAEQEGDAHCAGDWVGAITGATASASHLGSTAAHQVAAGTTATGQRSRPDTPQAARQLQPQPRHSQHHSERRLHAPAGASPKAELPGGPGWAAAAHADQASDARVAMADSGDGSAAIDAAGGPGAGHSGDGLITVTTSTTVEDTPASSSTAAASPITPAEAQQLYAQQWDEASLWADEQLRRRLNDSWRGEQQQRWQTAERWSHMPGQARPGVGQEAGRGGPRRPELQQPPLPPKPPLWEGMAAAEPEVEAGDEIVYKPWVAGSSAAAAAGAARARRSGR